MDLQFDSKKINENFIWNKRKELIENLKLISWFMGII